MDNNCTEICRKLFKLQWLLSQRYVSKMKEFGQLADTSKGQGRVLAMLKVQPEISTKALAYLLGIRQQSLNELLNRLEKGGYVERRQLEADKRIMIVCLTEKGRNVYQPESDFHDMLGCLSQNESVVLKECLDRMIACLEQKTGIDNEYAEMWKDMAKNSMGEETFDQFMQHNVQKPINPFAFMPHFLGRNGKV